MKTTTSDSPVPPITHPMGRHWNQPDHHQMAFDETHVLMTDRDFDDLGEYSTSIPSGVYEGKMWKCLQRGVWYLRWFGVSDDPDKVSNHHRVILRFKKEVSRE